MGFAKESGYVPVSVSTIMQAIMLNVNAQFGTSYTADTFIGTNFYKFFYALAQRMQESEVKTSEIFAYLQDYFATTNESIQRPVVTAPGLVEMFLREGYVASVKPPTGGDEGKVYICVDTDEDADDYDDVKLAICTLIKNSVVAGVITQGSESETIVLSNGQSFDFKFALPNRIPTLLKLTTVLSDNNQVVIDTPDDQKLKLIANIQARYALGKDFEPQKYFSTTDAPWAATVLLEWSINAGANYYSTVIDADFDDLQEIALEDVTLVET